MKTFKQYISEADKPSVDTEEKWHLVDALNLIKADCLQFLHKAASNGKFHPMYRGLQSSVWPKYEVRVRHTPKNESTDKDIRDSIRRVFTDKYGHAFGADAIFCTGGSTTGDKHLIFPIGKFDFLWSEKLDDLDNGLGGAEEDGELYYDMHAAEDDKSRDKLVKEFIKDNDFKHNQELKVCLDKGHEVMIECKYFYAIPSKVVHQYYDVFAEMIGELHSKKDLTA